MKALHGLPLQDLPLLEKLERVADYISFEGPLLSLYRAEGRQYFYHWCDRNASCNRWLLFPVTELERLDYLVQRMTLRQLIQSQFPSVYVLDYDHAGTPQAMQVVLTSGIPEEYLPAEDSLYEFEPHHLTSIAANTASVRLNERWQLSDMGTFEHAYNTNYAFVYALERYEELNGSQEAVRHAFTKFPWRGGSSRVAFYNELRSALPSKAKPAIRTMQYASPGWLELSLDSGVAAKLKICLQQRKEAASGLKSAIRDARECLRERGFSKVTGNGVDLPVTEELGNQFQLHFQTISQLMGFPYAKRLLSLTPNAVAAVKMLISFDTRLGWLEEFEKDQKAFL